MKSIVPRAPSAASSRIQRSIRLAAGASLAVLAIAGAARVLGQPSTPPEPPPPGIGANGKVSTAQFPDVGVIAPPRATAEQLEGDSVFHFILHHGTTHYSSAAGNVGGSLLRWRGGRSETICPGTIGLDPGYNAFVSARVRAIAAFVGAPVVKDDETCKPNVQIIFTEDPRSLMAKVQQWGGSALRVGFDHQMQKALDISDEHAIQGWYVTAGGGSSVLNRDAGLVGGISLQALWPRVIATSAQANGAGRSILEVVLVINTKKVVGVTIGSIADYAALVSLSVIENPRYCDPLPSILDIASPGCTSGDKPAGITAGDIAFLKALYYMNTGLGGTLSRDDIQINMLKELRGS
jgi:hypothetical protein